MANSQTLYERIGGASAVDRKLSPTAAMLIGGAVVAALFLLSKMI